ncbi:SusC/RagA family TonB-linked outer membrane protein [Bacteroides caecicola]|uniref:SusC/RagA family TonB-linked outer membrane protein n=1 Tax=Bacteroides caecicola TaxID=1462569 RepID=A0ABS2FB85_9BACE|nr:SusC/RagA family TonB-linked outer membrane protein [Bacteroides caecicola]
MNYQHITSPCSSAETLVISFIGLESQEVKIQPVVKVILRSDSEQLDEVVVTAMGISREKKALAYAVQDVKGEELTQAASTSLSSALQGKVSGVDITPSSGMPGASSQIVIRGVRSFTGDNTPLYVVDGMPISSASDIDTDSRNTGSVAGADFANRAVDLDPNDIESINILKGQAASALYGMRASNGVIVITTKSGKNATKGKPNITFNTNLSFNKVSTLPEFQKEYAQGSGGVYSPYASTAWGPKIADLANDATYGGNTDNAYTQQYGKHEGMYYVPQRANAGLDPWAVPQAYDNAKEFFNTGVSWSNNVNVSQAFDKGNYSFSLGNSMSEGIIPNTGMDRYNVKLNAMANLTENWTTGFSGNFITSKIRKQSSGNEGVIATVYGAPSSYDFNGIPSHVDGDPYTQNNYRSSTFNNAYWATENNSFIERSQRFFGNAYVQYKSNFGTDNHTLTAKYQLGADAYSTIYSDNYGYGDSYYPTGYSRQDDYQITEMNSLLTVTYDWKINADFDFSLMYGNEWVDKTTRVTTAQGYNFNFPGWNNIGNATTFQAGQSTTKKRTVGNFGNLSLSWKNMLYLNATIRNDVVSSMPRGNRSFTYPSVSLGWIFTELPFLKANQVLTFGKIRGSYAEVGMAGEYIENLYVTPAYGGGFSAGTPIQYPFGSVTSYVPYYRIYDPNLKPQNTKSYEIGLDLAFWHGLVSLNYTYSRQNVKDQIFAVPLSTSTGYSEMVTNGGAIHTNAHEITLTVNPVNKKNVYWDFGFNFSKIDNYVDKLADGVESIMLGGFVTPQVRASIGDKFPVIYGTSYLRNDEGEIVVDENGLPQAGAPGVIGKISPDFRLGFNTTLELYKFRLSAVFDWKQGGQMYCGTMGVLDYYGVTQRSADYRNKSEFLFEKPAVKQNADGTYSPNDITIKGENAYDYFNAMNSIDEASVYDNSFIKLREISLSYPVLDKKFLHITANVFARNILIWSELPGLDPEATLGNNNMAGAFERFSLPGSSSYGFGLTFKF